MLKYFTPLSGTFLTKYIFPQTKLTNITVVAGQCQSMASD